jgi:hypothetical protein
VVVSAGLAAGLAAGLVVYLGYSTGSFVAGVNRAGFTGDVPVEAAFLTGVWPG